MTQSHAHRSYLEPKSLKEALVLLDRDPELIPIAGCTDVFVDLQRGRLHAGGFLDLSRLRALRRIHTTASGLHIGALSTFTEIAHSRAIQNRCRALAQMAKEIGGRQIQNRATIGGNIATASPSGDSLPILLAADAHVVLQSISGKRRMPIASFFVDYRKTQRRPNELIARIDVPRTGGVVWARKVGTRRALAIAKVVFSGFRGSTVRIALGSVAPIPLRAIETEACLLSGGSIDDAAQVLSREIQPIDDIRSTANYRRQISINLLRQFWTETNGKRVRR